MNDRVIKKVLYFILIVLIIIGLVFFINNVLDKNNSYIILNSNNIIKVNKNKIQLYKKSYKKLDYSKAKLYKDNDVIDGYIFFENDATTGYTTLNFYKNSFDYEQSNDSIIVVGNEEIKNYTNLLNSNPTEQDLENITKYLKENSIGTLNDISEVSVANIKNRKIYVVKNFDVDDDKSNFSVIFSKENDNYELIYLASGQKLLNRSSELSKLVDINNDDNVDLILQSSVYGTDMDYCYSVYLYDTKTSSYKPIINCEEE